MRATITAGKVLIAVFIAVAAMACERRPLEDTFYTTAKIPVKIDWSLSGFEITDPSGGELIHRVSLRFFPKDGSAAFDKYLEGNVVEGEIEVPIGNYRVVVFNESIRDAYWADRVAFTDVDDYDRFAANVLPDDASNHPFYTPLTAEELIVEPLRLASWKLDSLEVTREMVTRTRAGEGCDALTCIVMRPLTYNVNVVAKVQNLSSAQLIMGAIRGLADKVYMASAETEQSPATYVFKLNGRTWDDASQVNGTTRKSFLSFGPLPRSASYLLNLDVVLTTGEVFDPSQWPGHEGQSLLYDVTGQVLTPQVPSDLDIDISVSLPLPHVEGGIYVGDWDDEIINLQ